MYTFGRSAWAFNFPNVDLPQFQTLDPDPDPDPDPEQNADLEDERRNSYQALHIITL